MTPIVHDWSSRHQVRLEGRDRVRLLHNICTADIQSLSSGQGCLASMVDRTGKLLAVVKVRVHADHLFLDSPTPIRTLIEKYIIMDDAKVVDSPGPITGYYGRPSALPLYHFESRDGKIVVSVPHGYEVFGERASPSPDEEWDRFRIDHGIPEWGKELDPTVIPVEAGLESTVSYSKGCYVGQEVLLRLRNFGEPKQVLRKIDLEQPAAPGPIPEGRITTVAGNRALAILRKEFKASGTRISVGTVVA